MAKVYFADLTYIGNDEYVAEELYNGWNGRCTTGSAKESYQWARSIARKWKIQDEVEITLSSKSFQEINWKEVE